MLVHSWSGKHEGINKAKYVYENVILFSKSVWGNR